MGVELTVNETTTEVIELHPTAPSPPGPQGIQGPPGNPTQYDLRGSGFPTVSAPVGTRYTDTSATNGAIEWIKAMGSGTTGWQVSYGDTGWRNIAGLMDSGWSAIGGSEYLRLRRVGAEVFLAGRIARVAAGGNISGLNILLAPVPSGFITSTPYIPMGPASTNNSGIVGSIGAYANYDSVHVGYFQNPTLQYTAGQTISVSAGWTTANPWPTTLPGTAA